MMNLFTGKIVIIGCGAVAQCTIPLIIKHIQIPLNNITIIDPKNYENFINEYSKKGINFKLDTITEFNFSIILSELLKPGDICIDLANEIDTLDLLNWCQTNNVMYLNSSLNVWNNSKNVNTWTYDIYKSVLKLKALAKKTTAIVSHGANPGLISSFTKQGIIDLANKALNENINKKNIENSLINNDFANLAHLLNIKVIHISEIDTQLSIKRKKDIEFFNTWSIVEFIKEVTAKVEFAWGTHEQKIPLNSIIKEGNIFFEKQALSLKVKSWVPYEEFFGITPPHDETFSIADFLTIKENEKLIYRPTVIFVYKPCLQARESLNELKSNEFVEHEKFKIIKKDIFKGIDKMGSLLMGHHYNSWWTGSSLNIEESNELVYGQNGTVVQVSAGILAALIFMIKNPNKGICFPEDLDHNEILKIAKPYLGKFISESIDWKPNNDWQFQSFLS